MALLVIGSVASLAANVAVAEPTDVGRVIAAWPSFALIGSYELLMRQVRQAATGLAQPAQQPSAVSSGPETPSRSAIPAPLPPYNAVRRELPAKPDAQGRREAKPETGFDARRQAWQWALANKAVDGALPSGKTIANRFGRHERWGRLVKSAGVAGTFAD